MFFSMSLVLFLIVVVGIFAVVAIAFIVRNEKMSSSLFCQEVNKLVRNDFLMDIMVMYQMFSVAY